MKTFKKVIKISFIFFCILLLSLILLGAGYYIFLNTSLKLNTNLLQTSAKTVSVYNAQNEEILPYTSSKVNFSSLQPYTINAFISIEDKNFYKHNGLNYKRIAKAVVNNIKAKDFVEGASTISQQLIKNTHLSHEKTIKRKLDELVLTQKLERNYSKDEILENYLNVIYFGNNSYGLEQASYNYFNKSASNLTISESAYLAGIIKSPRKYSPILNFENSITRRNLVLKEMFKDKYLSQEEYDIAINEEIILSPKNIAKEQKHYFNGTIDEACKILSLSEKDLMQGGYSIFTYQDSFRQNTLLKALENENYYSKNSYGNTTDSSALILDNKTGGIMAFGGKNDYDIVNMRRSPGSAIKPILVFAPALENGIINTLTPILDEKTDFNGYSPQNVGGYYGYVSPQKAIEKSLNIPAIKVLKSVGTKESINFAKNVGLQFDENDNNLSIALGCMNKGVSPLELAGSYLPFANGGEYIKPHFIRKICEHNGKVIYKANEKSTKVMSSATAYLMTEMLKGGVKNGTSKILNSLPFEVAGKTGTVGIKNTNLNLDAWSVAYTTDCTMLSWLGNSTGQKEYNLEGNNNGGTFATRIINETFENIYQNTAPCKFAQPQDIVFKEVDINSLKNNHVVELASSFTPEKDKILAPFNVKFVPKTESKNYKQIDGLILNCQIKKGVPALSFNTSKLYSYEIYRMQEEQTKLLKVIENSSGVFEFLDTTTLPNNFYSYYVLAIPIESKNSEKDFKNLTSENKLDLFNKILNLTRSKIFTSKKTTKNDSAIKSNVVKIYTKNN